MRCFRPFTVSLAMLMIFVLVSCGNTTVSQQNKPVQQTTSSPQSTIQGNTPTAQNTNMHGTSSCASYDGLIAQGDNFVHTTVQKIMGSPAWKQGAAIVINWDESDASQSGCCQSPTGADGSILGGGNVPFIVVTSQGPHTITLNDSSYNHYTLLATIEHLWNLGCIANTCSIRSANLMTKLFI